MCSDVVHMFRVKKKCQLPDFNLSQLSAAQARSKPAVGQIRQVRASSQLPSPTQLFLFSLRCRSSIKACCGTPKPNPSQLALFQTQHKPVATCPTLTQAGHRIPEPGPSPVQASCYLLENNPRSRRLPDRPQQAITHPSWPWNT